MMLPEIWSVTDRIFCHFGTFFALFPPNNPKNKTFQKMKKIPGGIITLHKCAKNHDHMLYGSWDMVHNGCKCYFSFWAIFCPFFCNCYLAVPLPTLGHSRGDSLTKPMLITSFSTSSSPRSPGASGSLSPAEYLVGFEPGTFRF